MTKEIKNKKVWRYTRYGFWFMMIGIIFAPIDIETNFEIGFLDLSNEFSDIHFCKFYKTPDKI